MVVSADRAIVAMVRALLGIGYTASEGLTSARIRPTATPSHC